MKKSLVIVFFALVLLAVGVYTSLYVPAYFNEKRSEQIRHDAALRAMAPEGNLADKYVERLSRKNDELARRGIKGKERQRLLEQEEHAINVEANRVRASNYTAKFDEKALPIEQK